MQITTLKWTFLNYPSLNFSFYSHYDLFIPFREFPNCYNPLRIQIDINLVLTSVYRFWEILSQNWGMNFDSSGCIFIPFLKILAFKVQKTADRLPSFGIFENKAKLQLQGLNFKLEFWDQNSQNRP